MFYIEKYIFVYNSLMWLNLNVNFCIIFYWMVIIVIECFFVCVVLFKELCIFGFLFIFSVFFEFDNIIF